MDWSYIVNINLLNQSVILIIWIYIYIYIYIHIYLLSNLIESKSYWFRCYKEIYSFSKLVSQGKKEMNPINKHIFFNVS